MDDPRRGLMGDTLCLDLLDAHVHLSSECAPLIDYARQHLQPLMARECRPADVRATLRWHEGAPTQKDFRGQQEVVGLERVDRDLYRGEGKLAWFRIDELPGLKLRFLWSKAALTAEGDYYNYLSRDPLRNFVKGVIYRNRARDLSRRRYTTLLYYLVYYPAFWWLERLQGLHPLHAAGVEIDDRVIVLAGPSGVGKSTLAVALAALPNARLLSDTFLMHRSAAVYPVREPLLLSGWSRRWLGDEARFLRRIDWRYCLQREGFHCAADRLGEGGRASVILLPLRSNRHYVERIPARRAQGQLSAGNAIVNDLRRYWAFAAALDMLDPTPLMAAREKELAQLVEEVPCYEVGLTGAERRDEVTALLVQVASGPDAVQSAAGGKGVGRRVAS